MKKTKYFLDTEFNEGILYKDAFWRPKQKPTIDLISIALVCEDGREFYAISKDFDVKVAWNKWQQRTGQGDYNNINPRHYWLRENVLFKVFKDLLQMHENFKNRAKDIGVFGDGIYKDRTEFTLKNFKYLLDLHGMHNSVIANRICEFIYQYVDDALDNISAVNAARYYGTSDESKNPMFYAYFADYDWVVFCQLFGTMMELPFGFPRYCIDLKQMLEAKKEAIKQSLLKNPDEIIQQLDREIKDLKNNRTNEHNALDDARFDRILYNIIIK